MPKTILPLLLILFLICACDSSSEKEQMQSKKFQSTPVLKALIVCVDDYEDDENNGISASVKRDYGTVSKFLDLLQSRQIVKLDKKVLMGKASTRENIYNEIKNMQVGANDVTFFYFSGHGGMVDNDKTVIYVRDGSYIMRDSIEALFTEKKSRLNILITDACSNASEGVGVTRSFRSGKKANEGIYDEYYKNLFCNYKGTLSLSASSPGEYAWSDADKGGYFTHFLVREKLLKNPSPNWEDIFDFAKEKVKQLYNLMPAEERSQLASTGIKSQTPKAYQMPEVIDATNKTEQIKDNTQTQITIENNSNKVIAYSIDYNSNEQNWDESKYKEYTLAAGANIQINQKCVLGIKANGKETFYELDVNGKYFIDNDNGNVALFEESSNESNPEKDLTQYLTGAWKWETANGSYTMNFTSDANYNIKSGSDIIENGTWKVLDFKFQKTNINAITFDYQSQENGRLVLTYEIILLDDGSVQLNMVQAKLNNEAVELSQFSDEDAVIMLFK